MNTLLLPIALLLPWLAGAAALRPLRERLGLTRAGWLGYGYFLGAAGVAASALLASLLPGLANPTGLILTLAALTLATGLGATWVARRLPAATPLALPPTTRRERWLTALLLALIAVHLGFAVFELYWRPVYPWDAWQTWLYTAKSWYFSGAPVDMLPPEQWPNLPDNSAYTVQGHDYPWLPPAQSWWLASVMGAWQENRVAWPALPAAIALGLALWGQAVAATGKRLAGPLAAGLLLSLPLLHTHIALAGYADLWLAGFSGLGLIALVRGLLEAHRGQLLLGLAALALGLLVKHDALIWLTCGLLLAGLLRLRQMKITTLALTGAFIVGALTVGLSRLDLQLHAKFARYSELLWLADSWHLLWYLLPAAVLLPGSPARAVARVFGLLLAVILASQLILFGATNAGDWVTTAASRLLLQVSPLLVFALACIAGASAGPAPIRHQWGRNALAVLAGSLCLLVLLGAWLLAGAPTGNRPAEALDFKAQQLRAVKGPMRHRHNRLQLASASEGYAIVSSGPVRFDAATYDILDVAIDGAGENKHTLFWRTTANSNEGFARRVALGAGPVTLSDDSNWAGEIIEVGMVLFPNPEQPLILDGVRFEAVTPLTLLRQGATDWLTPSHWTQASAHYIELATKSSLPSPSLPLMAGLWVLLCWACLRLFTGAKVPLGPLFGVALFAWLVLDVRWLHNSYHQALATRDHYTNATDPEALDLNGDASILELARQARTLLGQEPHQLLVLELDEKAYDKFASRRLKYALLPHAAHIHDDRVSRAQAASMDAIIWLTFNKTGKRAKCPWPLQHIKPVLVTSRGVLCTLSPQPSIEGHPLKDHNTEPAR